MPRHFPRPQNLTSELPATPSNHEAPYTPVRNTTKENLYFKGRIYLQRSINIQATLKPVT